MSASAELQGIGDQIAVAVKLKATKVSVALDGTRISVVPAGKRGADQNAKIAGVQADKENKTKWKRNPWYISREDMEPIRFVLKAIGSPDASVRQRAIKSVGDLMLIAVAKNIEKQLNPGGSAFTPLSKAYAAFKQRKFGFIAPILKASGDLIGDLRIAVDKIR